MIVVDTSFVYALLDRRDRRHAEAAGWYEGFDDGVATTPLILAEIDHLTRTRTGSASSRAFRRNLADGAYLVEWWDDAGSASVEVAEAYADLGLSLADASLVALAARLGTHAIATFDERHFRALRPLAGRSAFQLLPIDA